MPFACHVEGGGIDANIIYGDMITIPFIPHCIFFIKLFNKIRPRSIFQHLKQIWQRSPNPMHFNGLNITPRCASGYYTPLC